ncbi:MAG: hypothetical protein ACYDAJ_08460 [Nitrosotalea sp.]
MPPKLPNLTCKSKVAGPKNFYVKAFGIDGYVMEGSANGLSQGLSWTIMNTGTASTRSPYTIEVVVRRLVLFVSGGATRFVPGKIIFRCKKAGPTILPSRSATINFTQSSCSPSLPSKLPCGLYEEKLTIDTKNQVKQSNKRGNKCVRYYHVPSKIKKINIQVVPNPDNVNSNIMEVSQLNEVSVIAPLVNPNFNARAFHVTITTIPQGEKFALIYQKHVDGAQAGDFADMNRVPPVGGPLAKFGKGPVDLDYTVTVPHPNFAKAPCTNIFPFYYEEKLDNMITAISKEGPGCVLAQRLLRLSVLHECR